MLRHSRVATTTDVYMQTMEDGVRSTVTSIHEELMGTGTTGQHSSETRVRQRIENFSAGEATLNTKRRSSTSSHFGEEETSNHASCSR